MSFSQLPAVEKDTEKWAAGKILGPSYFEATLVIPSYITTYVYKLLYVVATYDMVEKRL